MPKPILYLIIAIETVVLIILGAVLLSTSNSDSMPTDTSDNETAVPLTAREMSVYVKATGAGEQATDAVGKVYVQDDRTGRTEFLFDLGAGCFPTWTLNPLNGYNLMVDDAVDVVSISLEELMRNGQLRYNFRVNGDLQISKIMGIRSATLDYNDQTLRLNQQCS